MWNAVITCLRKYAVFKGRATRREYWWFFVARVAALILAILAGLFGFGGIAGLAATIEKAVLLLSFIPWLAVNVRRLHDVNTSGWLALIELIPFGWLLLVAIYLKQPSYVGVNRFGEEEVGALPARQF